MHKKCHKVEIKAHTTVADLEGGRASSAPPPFGRRTDAVTHGHVS